MRFHRLSVAAIEGAYFLRYGAAVDSFQEQCMDLGDSLKLDNTTTISFTKYVPAGTNLTFPDNDPTCGQFSQIVSNDLCRVALLVRTSSVSNFSMEAWLPRNWTGRFLSIGNSASSGCKLSYMPTSSYLHGVAHVFRYPVRGSSVHGCTWFLYCRDK